MARAAAPKPKNEQEPEMDEGRFAPPDAIEGEIIQSTERALRKAGDDDGFADLGTSLAVKQGQADLDQLIVTAHKFPRSIQGALDNICTLATLDTPTALECNYALPRGRDENGKAKAITGPSIRLAEIIASQWGNCRTGAQVVSIDRENKVVVAEGIFLDLQTNYQSTVRVQRRISDKRGNLFNDDMIVVTGNAASSIALRNAILRGVPKPVWRKAYAAVLGVITGDVKTIGARRVELLVKFQEMGVKAAQVYSILSVKGENDIGPEELVVAAGFYSALRNNEVTVEDLLRDAQGPQTSTKTLAGAFGAAGAKPPEGAKAPEATKPQEEPKPAQEKSQSPAATTPAHDPQTGEVIDEGGGFPGDRPAETGQAATDEDAGQAQEEFNEEVEEEFEDAHVPGSERTDPAAFLRWASTVNEPERKVAFVALSRTPAYKGLDEAARDMIAAAVTNEPEAVEPAVDVEAEGDQITVGHADPGEVYFMAGDGRDENARRTTYKDGVGFSTTGRDDHRVYEEHPPAPAVAKNSAPEGAVGVFWQAIDGKESWLQIKAQLTPLYGSEEFKAMDAAEQSQLRIEIWEVVDKLVAAKKDPLDFVTDPAAFRLWLEWVGDADAIQGNFDVLKRQPNFTKQGEAFQNGLQNVVLRRINTLRAGA